MYKNPIQNVKAAGWWVWSGVVQVPAGPGAGTWRRCTITIPRQCCQAGPGSRSPGHIHYYIYTSFPPIYCLPGEVERFLFIMSFSYSYHRQERWCITRVRFGLVPVLNITPVCIADTGRTTATTASSSSIHQL